MRKTGTYYLLITLSLFVIFTAGLYFMSNRPSSTQNQSQSQTQPENQGNPSQNTDDTPIPLVGETENYLEVEKLQSERPWIKQVPIVKDNYITRYNYENDSIEIVVYTTTGFSYSEEDLKKIRTEVEQTLSQRGIDLNSVKITARVE